MMPRFNAIATAWVRSFAPGFEKIALRYQSRRVLLHAVEQEEPNRSDHELIRYRRILRNLLPETAAELRGEPALKVEVAKHPTARILQVADEVGANPVVMDVPGSALAGQSLLGELSRSDGKNLESS